MPRFSVATLLALGLAFFALFGCGEAARNDADETSSVNLTRQETTGAGEITKQECAPGESTGGVSAVPAGIVDKQLVRRADNIFVGRVIEKAEERSPAESGGPLPETAFAVKVERNVKGSLSGTVTVVQAGGCDPKYGEVVLINEDPLLKPGERAIFSTGEYSSPADTHYIVGSKYGDMRVETRAQEKSIIARLRDDRKEFVPYRLAKRDEGPNRKTQ